MAIRRQIPEKNIRARLLCRSDLKKIINSSCSLIYFHSKCISSTAIFRNLSVLFFFYLIFLRGQAVLVKAIKKAGKHTKTGRVKTEDDDSYKIKHELTEH